MTSRRIRTPWREDNLPKGPELFRIIEPNFQAFLYEEPNIDSRKIAYLLENQDDGAPLVGYLGELVKNAGGVRFFWFFVITTLGVGWVISYNCTRKLDEDYSDGSLY